MKCTRLFRTPRLALSLIAVLVSGTAGTGIVLLSILLAYPSIPAQRLPPSLLAVVLAEVEDKV